jgi:hypothetical protein
MFSHICLFIYFIVCSDIVDSNAMIIPGWGGVVVANIENLNSKSTVLNVQMLKPTFSLFVAQLRALLGVPPLHDDDKAVRHIPSKKTTTTNTSFLAKQFYFFLRFVASQYFFLSRG